MQLHELRPKHPAKKKTRVGRGGKKGTYSGKGMKGQRSRAGVRLAPVVREVLKHYPKLKGYRSQKRRKSMRTISLAVLERNFQDKEKVTPQLLAEKKLLASFKGKVPVVKIIGKGATKAFFLEGCLVSSGAADSITKAGGSVV
tara:strand:- start:4817 stop:5245 length:429 start_codon:yes stop_codon:yes gene_type:complete